MNRCLALAVLASVLVVREKRPEGLTRFTSDNVVLFVHGATYPAESSFDLALDGVSWMDWIAPRGWDVYLLDMMEKTRMQLFTEVQLFLDERR